MYHRGNSATTSSRCTIFCVFSRNKILYTLIDIYIKILQKNFETIMCTHEAHTSIFSKKVSFFFWKNQHWVKIGDFKHVMVITYMQFFSLKDLHTICISKKKILGIDTKGTYINMAPKKCRSKFQLNSRPNYWFSGCSMCPLDII